MGQQQIDFWELQVAVIKPRTLRFGSLRLLSFGMKFLPDLNERNSLILNLPPKLILLASHRRWGFGLNFWLSQGEKDPWKALISTLTP